MLEYIEQLTSKYREAGVLLDTNLLLLLVVGLWRQEHISQFKRTQTFTASDFLVLNTYLSSFDQVIATPHIATETSNFLGQLSSRDARASRVVFRKLLNSELDHVFVEVSHPAPELALHEMFPGFGLADTALESAGRNQRLVLTDDLPLYHYLSQIGVDTLNYNYLRTANW